VSASRRASTRGANGEGSEPNKKGAKRVKSPKSKSPAPAVLPSAPSSAVENEDVSDSIVQLKGHEAEVRGHVAVKLAANLESIRSSFVLGTLLNIIY
jgi:hypothetical protein